MNELTYTRCGDYYIPDLKLSEQPEAPIGKYGRMRRRYLKEHRPGLYSSLILSEKLYPHLLEIDRAAHERMDAMLPRMMEAAGVTEELKARDPMRWVGLMNTLKAQAEEVIFGFCEKIRVKIHGDTVIILRREIRFALRGLPADAKIFFFEINIRIIIQKHLNPATYTIIKLHWVIHSIFCDFSRQRPSVNIKENQVHVWQNIKKGCFTDALCRIDCK